MEAVNSLLKFLEEPTPGTYAILTSQNEAKVLPTIISRCESMRLLLLPREEVVKDALDLGTAPEDADILANFYNDGQMIKDEAASEDYQNAKSAFVDELDALNQNASMARYVMVSYLSDGRVPASHIASTRFQRIETSHKVSFTDLSEHGFTFVGGTGILGKGATRSEGAAAGGIKWARNIAFKNDAFVLAGGLRIGRRNRGKQRNRVRMHRILKQGCAIGELDDVTEVHGEGSR